MSELKITKVKYLDDEVIINVVEKFEDGKKLEHPAAKGDWLPHQDFLDTLDAFRPHLAIMSGYVKPGQVKSIDSMNPELYEDFRVNGISLGKDDDDPGVTIQGGRILPHMNGKYQQLNSCYVRFEEVEETAYKHKDHLRKITDRLMVEANAYYRREKIGVDPQGKLDFNGSGQEKPADQSETPVAA